MQRAAVRRRLAQARRLLARATGSAPPAAASEASVEAPSVARLAREGPTPLGPAPDTGQALDVAIVVPHFRRGSGGHTTIANLVRGLEGRGHRCSIWIHDPQGRAGGPEAFRAFFGPFAAAVHPSLDAFPGAGVAVATGWQTVAPVLLARGCGARAYLVQDHEPDFYPASAERLWAGASYDHGLHCLTAGTWLAEMVAAHGARATPFELGIDHDLYRPLQRDRASARVIFYARAATPRRAVPLGLAALAEVATRRPEVEIVLFGDPQPPDAPFAFEHLGVASGPELAAAYNTATVGVVLSLTNHSLVAQEMLACGLPAVELDTPSTRAAFGPDPPLELAPAEPEALAAAIERLLDDPELRARRATAGVAYAASRTWEAAAEQVELGLLAAIRAAGA
jgi:glycosyltransferase involved in cell wall biosynthesis